MVTYLNLLYHSCVHVLDLLEFYIDSLPSATLLLLMIVLCFDLQYFFVLVLNLQRDLTTAQEKISDQNTRLTSAESTWQMAENLYRQLADTVRDHTYDLKDLTR